MTEVKNKQQRYPSSQISSNTSFRKSQSKELPKNSYDSYTNQETRDEFGNHNLLNKSKGGVGSLHETDLFKIAVRNMSE